MNGSFAHLRVSSEYSIFKGLLSIEKLVEKAKSFGMPAIALTDHSNMFGLVKFFKKINFYKNGKNGKKYILKTNMKNLEIIPISLPDLSKPSRASDNLRKTNIF